ncbi:unnamed protein product, partial [Mesorhabditis spiculigera]
MAMLLDEPGEVMSKRSWKSILKVLDNNYTHSISKAAIGVHFKTAVAVNLYDRDGWDQWTDGMVEVGRAVGMNEQRQARLREREARKLANRMRRPNWNGKYGFAQLINSRQDAEALVTSVDKGQLSRMLVSHCNQMHALRISNARMHLALAIEEHKALLAREYAEECHVKMNLLRDESAFYRRQLMMSTRNPVFFGSVADLADEEEESDDEPLEAENHLLFTSDTRRINQARMMAQQKCKVPSKLATAHHDKPSEFKAVVDKLVSYLPKRMSPPKKPASPTETSPIEVARSSGRLRLQLLPSPPCLVYTPVLAERTHAELTPSTSGTNTTFDFPGSSLISPPRTARPPSYGPGLDDPTSPIPLMEMKAALRVDEKASIDLDDAVDLLEKSQFEQQQPPQIKRRSGLFRTIGKLLTPSRKKPRPENR